MKQKLRLMTAVLYGSMVLMGCSIEDHPVAPSTAKSIVILYENDVHCNIDGYSKLAGWRDAINQSDTAYAMVVSCGDYLQGGLVGAISKGQNIINIMSKMNYAAVTIGNHEFDYGGSRMEELLSQVNAPVVCCNFFNYGAAEPIYAPYVVQQYGDKKIAFVGVCTPETESAESYAIFDTDGSQLYDLRNEDVPTLVQQAVDNARSEGANYVVLLSHLGEAEKEDAISSYTLVSKTKGIDVVLDGHSHAIIERHDVNNMDGQPVNVTQTGTQFANIGKLLIKDGRMTTTLIPLSEIPYENATITDAVQEVKDGMVVLSNRQVATSDYELTINGPNGRLIRSGETNLGDLIADAFRITMNADIGMINGGGVRSGIPAGVITYGHIVNVLPHDNNVCTIEATGDELIEMLSKCTAQCPAEDGNFPQVSGIRYTIHTASHTVSDVEVMDANGTYQPIDADRKYTVATLDYYLSGGFYGMLKTCKLIEMGPSLMRDVLAYYMEYTLGGTTGTTYAQPAQRITIVNDD